MVKLLFDLWLSRCFHLIIMETKRQELTPAEFPTDPDHDRLAAEKVVAELHTIGGPAEVRRVLEIRYGMAGSILENLEQWNQWGQCRHRGLILQPLPKVIGRLEQWVSPS